MLRAVYVYMNRSAYVSGSPFCSSTHDITDIFLPWHDAKYYHADNDRHPGGQEGQEGEQCRGSCRGFWGVLVSRELSRLLLLNTFKVQGAHLLENNEQTQRLWPPRGVKFVLSLLLSTIFGFYWFHFYCQALFLVHWSTTFVDFFSP